MWLHVPFLTPDSLCAPASADSVLESNLPCPDLPTSATWRGKPFQPRSWPRAWRIYPWLRRLSGLTCLPSTAALGVESWISSLRASRASLTASPESAPEPKTSGGSGPTSCGSFARFDPRTSSWKTSQGSLALAGSTPASVTWPRSGSMRSGRCYARPTLAPLTSGRGCSFWPTATVNGNNNVAGLSPTSGDGLATAAKAWATAAAREWKDGACAEQDVPTNGLLGRQVIRCSLPAPATPTDGAPSSPTTQNSPQLNPAFVEWLMGLPRGWLDFEPVELISFERWEMAWSRAVRLLPSSNSGSDYTETSE